MERALLIAMVAGALGCGGPEFTSQALACDPGEQFPCVCGDGSSRGTMTCDAAGDAVGACVCAKQAPPPDAGSDAATPTVCDPSWCTQYPNAVAHCEDNKCSWTCVTNSVACGGSIQTVGCNCTSPHICLPSGCS